MADPRTPEEIVKFLLNGGPYNIETARVLDKHLKSYPTAPIVTWVSTKTKEKIYFNH